MNKKSPFPNKNVRRAVQARPDTELRRAAQSHRVREYTNDRLRFGCCESGAGATQVAGAYLVEYEQGGYGENERARQSPEVRSRPPVFSAHSADAVCRIQRRTDFNQNSSDQLAVMTPNRRSSTRESWFLHCNEALKSRVKVGKRSPSGGSGKGVARIMCNEAFLGADWIEWSAFLISYLWHTA